MIVHVAVSTWVSVGMLGFAIGQTTEVPGAGWLTGAAGLVGIVAIAQAVRAIGRTEAEKTQVIDALQEELRAKTEEIRELHQMIMKREGGNP